jgi:uncharacterized protein
VRKCFRKLVYLVVVVWSSLAVAGTYEDFFKAIELDDAGTVARLLARGFDPNTPDPTGQVGLFLALRGGAHRVGRALVEHADTKIDTPNAAGETPLMMAALRGSLEWTQRLAERGAPINRSGWTPLHYAASGPEPKVVAYLLDRGAAINAPAPNGSTALMMAARYGNEESVDLMLARGADVRVRNQRNLNAADFARGADREALASRLDALAR